MDTMEHGSIPGRGALADQRTLRGLAVASTIWLAACVQPNPDFTEFTNTSTVAPQAGATQEQTQTTPTGNPTASTQPASNQTNSSIAENSGGEYPSTGSAGDMAKGRWLALAIDTSQLPVALASGYALSATFDHQSMIQAGALSNGDDLAVVYKNGNTLTQLDRVIDPLSRWGMRNSKIWFASQSTLTASAAPQGEYFIVQGSGAFPPKDDPQAIFSLFDDFDEENSLDSKLWESEQSSQGSPTLSISNGSMRLAVESSDGSSNLLTTSTRSVINAPGLRVDVRTRYPETVDNVCAVVSPILFRDANTQQIYSGYSFIGRELQTIALVNQTEVFSPLIPARSDDGGWTQHSLSWYANTIKLSKSGLLLSEQNNTKDVPPPAQQALDVALSVHATGSACVGPKKAQLEVDWIRIRPYVWPEPRVTIK